MSVDYKHAYAIRKDKDARKTLGASVTTETAEEFKAKCSLENTTPGALIKEFIYSYINGELTFDGESIKAQK